MRLPFLALCLLLISGCGSAPKYGTSPDTRNYVGDGVSFIRWTKPDLLFRVGPGLPDNLGGAAIRRRVVAAFLTWSPVVAGTYTLREAKDGEAEDIHVKWVKVLSLGGDFFGDTVYGQSHTDNVVIGGVEYIASAVISLDYQLSNQPLRTTRVSIHEMGHILGLRGHPKAYGSIMNSPVPDNIYYPQQIDYNTFRIYAKGTVP